MVLALAPIQISHTGNIIVQSSSVPIHLASLIHAASTRRGVSCHGICCAPFALCTLPIDARNIIVTRIVSNEPSVTCHTPVTDAATRSRPPSLHVRVPVLISQNRGAPRTGAAAGAQAPRRATTAPPASSSAHVTHLRTETRTRPAAPPSAAFVPGAPSYDIIHVRQLVR